MEMKPKEIHSKLMEMGVSDLDAGLVVNCINVKKSYTWLNTDPVSQDDINQINEFLEQNEMGIKIKISEVPYQGKYIWEVKVASGKPTEETKISHEPEQRHGPEGRFKTLSELGL